LRFVLAGVVYVGSAVGLETVWVALGSGPDGVYDWVTLCMVMLEEGGEFVGTALFICALVDYLHSTGARLELTFGAHAGARTGWPKSSPRAGRA
jgi:hypothetical protein